MISSYVELVDVWSLCGAVNCWYKWKGSLLIVRVWLSVPSCVFGELSLSETNVTE